ncbi:MAG: hypothetical protein FWG64_04385 [Firmicutes bacterium]|nr:hypothetical protein [Bacillota bacterium]
MSRKIFAPNFRQKSQNYSVFYVRTLLFATKFFRKKIIITTTKLIITTSRTAKKLRYTKIIKRKPRQNQRNIRLRKMLAICALHSQLPIIKYFCLKFNFGKLPTAAHISQGDCPRKDEEIC